MGVSGEPSRGLSVVEPQCAPAQFAGNDRFELIKQLGAGGMGVVYLAFDREMQVEVALKTILGGNPALLQRFKYEFRALAGISHPNLVALYELVASEGYWFFTMERLVGVDFLRHVWVAGREGDSGDATRTALPAAGAPFAEEASTLTTGDAPTQPGSLNGSGHAFAIADFVPTDYQVLRDTLYQVVRGIQRLHESGFLHRDIKPSNIIVTSDGRAVLLDFGVITEMARPGADLVGTPAYMAPEQSVENPASPASDLYSVGVMLYQALAGNLPFRGPTPVMLALKQRLDPPMLHTLRPDVPEDLSRVCARLLSRDPAERPGVEELLRILSRRGRRNSLGWTTRRREEELIGREDIVSSILRHHHANRIDGGRAVALCARSGMGKSAVTRHVVRQLSARGDLVLEGRCYEREMVPHKAVDGIIDALAHHLRGLDDVARARLDVSGLASIAALFPVMATIVPAAPIDTLEPQIVRRQAVRALRSLLEQVATRQPVTLIIDDLQWGDVDSIPFLEDLANSPRGVFVLLLLRAEDRDRPYLADLLSRPALRNVSLVEMGPLGEEESRQLLQATLGEGRGPLIDGLIAESQGSPFVLNELAAWLLERGAIDGRRQPTVMEAMRDRLESLSADALGILRVIALAGAPISNETLIEAVGIPRQDWLTGVHRLLGSQLVMGSGTRRDDELSCYHDKLREAVVSLAPAENRVALHGRLAGALESLPAVPHLRVAYHFSEAGVPRSAAAHAICAADDLQRAYAFERAADTYEWALALQPDMPERPRVLRAWARSLADAGRGVRAAEAYAIAAGESEVADRRDLTCLAAEQLIRAGHLEAGLARLADVLPAYGLPVPRGKLWAIFALLGIRTRLALRPEPVENVTFAREDRSTPVVQAKLHAAWSAGLLLSITDPLTAYVYQSQLLLDARRYGHRHYMALGYLCEASVSSVGGSRAYVRTAEYLARAWEFAKHEPSTRAYWHGFAAFTACCEGRWARNRELADRGLAAIREDHVCSEWELQTIQLYRLISGIFAGDWGRFGPELELLLPAVRDKGDLYSETNLCARILPYAHLAADRGVEALDAATTATDRWSGRGLLVQHIWAATSRLEALVYMADADSVLAEEARVWRLVRGSLAHAQIQHLRIELGYLRGRAFLVNAAARPLERSRFLSRCRGVIHGLRSEKAPWGNVFAHLLAASVAAQEGRRTAAIEDFVYASVLGIDAGMPMHAAAANVRAGELLGGEDGNAMVRRGEGWLSSNGFVSPSNMVRCLAPTSSR